MWIKACMSLMAARIFWPSHSLWLCTWTIKLLCLRWSFKTLPVQPTIQAKSRKETIMVFIVRYRSVYSFLIVSVSSQTDLQKWQVLFHEWTKPILPCFPLSRGLHPNAMCFFSNGFIDLMSSEGKNAVPFDSHIGSWELDLCTLLTYKRHTLSAGHSPINYL